MSLPAAPRRIPFGAESGHSAASVAAARQQSVVVCVPTRDEAASIAATVGALVALRRSGVIDRVLVVDDSADATPSLAAAAGAEVVRQRDLDPHVGPVLGKGDAMWRALGACEEDVVCFVDGDSSDFGEHHVVGLVGAVAVDGSAFAKGTYRRPFIDVTGARATGGGRVTELTAKPLLRAVFPELLAFDQPLAGEIAAPVELLRSLPVATGYGVDVALLIDVWSRLGLTAMAEVDLGSRQNRHRPLHELGAMATEVARAILLRSGAPTVTPPLVERPPRIATGSRQPA